MKLFRSKYLLVGVLAGLLAGGGWLAWGAIQSQVGVNNFNPTNGQWLPQCFERLNYGLDGNPIITNACGTADNDVIQFLFNGTTYDRIRSASIGDNAPATGLNIGVPFLFNGTTFDRPRGAASDIDAQATSATAGLAQTASRNFVFNGTTFDRMRSANGADATAGTGLLGSGLMAWDNASSVWRRMFNAAQASGTVNFLGVAPMLNDGTGTMRTTQSTSATTLTNATTNSALLTANLSTWTVTSGPAAGTQATASKAAGGGTVRHVATTISACYSDTAVAVARHVNLRDGASGAGTILARWMLAIPAANDSHCVTLSGFSIIGTANTAMTLEFDAAGAATSEQTVNLTGYSVP